MHLRALIGQPAIDDPGSERDVRALLPETHRRLERALQGHAGPCDRIHRFRWNAGRDAFLEDGDPELRAAAVSADHVLEEEAVVQLPIVRDVAESIEVREDRPVKADFLLLDGVRFLKMRAVLADSWRRRSFDLCRDFCFELLWQAESFDARYHVSEGEPLVKQVVRGLPFDRDFWRALVGELFFYTADEIPENELLDLWLGHVDDDRFLANAAGDGEPTERS